MLLVTSLGEFTDRERPSRLKHERDRAIRDLHPWRVFFRSRFEFFVGNSMRNRTALEQHSPKLKFVRSATVIPIDQPHKLRTALR